MPPDTARPLPERLHWLRDLLAAVEAADLAELELGTGGLRVYVRRRVTTAGAPAIAAVPAAAAPPAADKVAAATAPVTAAAPGQDLLTVRTPLTGMFYTAPTPQDAPYVEVGDPVEVDQVVALVEAMKVFNEIRSEQRGVVERVVAENGQLVHADQPLLLLRPVEGGPEGASPLAPM